MTGKTNRLKTGRRLDAIIRTVEDDYHEYGGMEVARSFRGVTSSKWLGDSFKLAKALRDMLFRLHELVDHDNTITKKLQVVGVFNAGTSRTDHNSHYYSLTSVGHRSCISTHIYEPCNRICVPPPT